MRQETNGAGMVLDSSLTMAWCFADEQTEQTQALLARLGTEGGVVPSLWPLEVSNVLLVGERRGRVTPAQSAQFVATLRALPIMVDEETSRRAWDQILTLARQHRLSVYDAAYLELALRRGLPLATLDGDLQVAARSLGVVLL